MSTKSMVVLYLSGLAMLTGCAADDDISSATPFEFVEPSDAAAAEPREVKTSTCSIECEESTCFVDIDLVAGPVTSRVFVTGGPRQVDLRWTPHGETSVRAIFSEYNPQWGSPIEQEYLMLSGNYEVRATSDFVRRPESGSAEYRTMQQSQVRLGESATSVTFDFNLQMVEVPISVEAEEAHFDLVLERENAWFVAEIRSLERYELPQGRWVATLRPANSWRSREKYEEFELGEVLIEPGFRIDAAPEPIPDIDEPEPPREPLAIVNFFPEAAGRSLHTPESATATLIARREGDGWSKRYGFLTDDEGPIHFSVRHGTYDFYVRSENLEMFGWPGPGSLLVAEDIEIFDEVTLELGQNLVPLYGRVGLSGPTSTRPAICVADEKCIALDAFNESAVGDLLIPRGTFELRIDLGPAGANLGTFVADGEPIDVQTSLTRFILREIDLNGSPLRQTTTGILMQNEDASAWVEWSRSGELVLAPQSEYRHVTIGFPLELERWVLPGTADEVLGGGYDLKCNRD